MISSFSVEGIDYALRCLCESGLWLRLYTNQHIPESGDTADSYQEPLGGGYQPILIPYEAWTIADGEAVSDEMVFTFDGPAGMVYGYFLTGSDGSFITAYAADEPERIRAEGDEIAVKVSLGVQLR